MTLAIAPRAYGSGFEFHYLHPPIKHNTLNTSTSIALSDDFSELRQRLENAAEKAKEERKPQAALAILLHTLPRIETELNAGRCTQPDKAKMLFSVLSQQVIKHYQSAPAQCSTQCWTQFLHRSKHPNNSLLQIFSALNLLLNFEFGLAAKEVLKKEDLDNFQNDGLILIRAFGMGFSNSLRSYLKSKPIARMLQLTGAFNDQHFCHFSVRKAMQHAWVASARLVKSHPAELPKKIQDLDSYVAVLNRLIFEPGVVMKTLVSLPGI